jgi:hypothetical protein
MGNHGSLKGREGSLGKRETFQPRCSEGEPKRPKDPREQRPRPELNLQAAMRGTANFVG